MSPTVLEETKAAASGKTTLMLPLTRLQQALATVTLAVERKTTIPVLSSVRVESCDGYVDFAGTNLDLATRVRVTLPEAKEEKPFLLPGLKLETFARLLQGETVSITCHDDRRATLKCGRSTTRLPLQSTASFPKITVADGMAGIDINQEVAARLLEYTAFAISKEESRYTLAGALFEITRGTMCLVATDGHRLARYTVPTDELDASSILLPLGMVRVIDKVLSHGKAPLKIASDEQNVYANLQGDGFAVALAHRSMTGKFPNYDAVMPRSFIATVTVDAETVLHALRRCQTFADANSGAVKFSVRPDTIALRSASADTGETDEVIDVTAGAAFEEFHIGFNVDYLMDAFARLKGDVQIRFSGEHGAAMITASPAEGETFDYVVMPMRV